MVDTHILVMLLGGAMNAAQGAALLKNARRKGVALTTWQQTLEYLLCRMRPFTQLSDKCAKSIERVYAQASQRRS